MILSCNVYFIIYNLYYLILLSDYLHLIDPLLLGIPNYSTGDPLDISDPVKIWERHSKELIEQLGYNNNTLIALTAGLHIEDVIDKETKSAIFSASIDGGDILVKSVKEKLAGPKSLQLILDIMDQQDPLCGLVRRMRRDLGLLEGNLYYIMWKDTIQWAAQIREIHVLTSESKIQYIVVLIL